MPLSLLLRVLLPSPDGHHDISRLSSLGSAAQQQRQAIDAPQHGHPAAKVTQPIEPDLKRILSRRRYVVKNVHGIFAFRRISVNPGKGALLQQLMQRM